MQKSRFSCCLLSILRCRIRTWVIVFPCSPSNSLTSIEHLSCIDLVSRNLVVSIANKVFIKTNPFALESIKEYKSILYLLHNIVYRTIKWFLLINQLKSICWRLMKRGTMDESRDGSGGDHGGWMIQVTWWIEEDHHGAMIPRGSVGLYNKEDFP